MKVIFRGLILILLSFFPANNFDIALGSQPNERKGNDRNPAPTWEIFQSPTSSNLSRIIMLSPGSGFLVGRYLSYFNGKIWQRFLPHPEVPIISNVFASNKNNVWITYNTNSSESEVFHFNGKRWKQVYLPLANTVLSMSLSENNIEWIGGDREIARRNGSSWKFLSFPGSYGVISYIYSINNKKAWVMTSESKVFFYDENKWIQYLNDEKIIQVYFINPELGYFLTKKRLIKYDGQNFTTHSRSKFFKKISKMSFLKNGEIWGIGANRLIIHWNLHNWERVSSPALDEFSDIMMISPDEGWIVGHNGMILHYSPVHEQKPGLIKMGFNAVKIGTASKDIMDEYGVAMDDINNDGLKDIYAVCIYDPNRLYINNCKFDSSGRIQTVNFNEEASSRGVNGVSSDSTSVNFNELELGVGLADIDNDGDLDIYLCNLLGKNKLFLNNGHGYFRNVSGESNRGIGFNERTNAAVWGDVDNDGDLDLFITNENSTNRLFLNNGNGYFTEVTKSAGLITPDGGMGAAFCDIDGDGKLDLCVTNWARPNLLYHNISTKDKVKFENISVSAGIEGEPFTKSNAVIFFDYDNDGMPDLFITNRKRSNRLYHNQGNCKFIDVTDSVIGKDTMLSYGAASADFDQDGFQDLYVANVGENIIYKNYNGKKFIPITTEYGAQMSGYSTGCAVGDIDNDGDEDLYVASFIRGNSILFINNCKNNNFIKFNVKGTISNRDAIGTEIYLYKAGHAGDKKNLLGYREISGGSGYGSFNAREVHFGLENPGKYDVVIFFPASRVKKILSNISSGKLYDVYEEEGSRARITLFTKGLKRTISDPAVHKEVIKFLIVLLIILLSIYRGNKKYKWKISGQIIFHAGAFGLYWIQILLLAQKGFLLADLLPVTFVVIVLVIIHLFYERVILVRINKTEKQNTRDRIARDLHDDLASTLSSSVIYNEALKRSIKNPTEKESELLNKINTLLLEASDAVTDIVWAVSPAHDKIDGLIMRLKNFIIDCCKTNNIGHEIISEIDEPEISLTEDFRRNIYLIFKEALNNIVKYASPSNIRFTVKQKNKHLELILEDDGIGFNVEEFLIDDGNGEYTYKLKPGTLNGNGLKNMVRRAKEVNAGIKIDSSPGKGTKLNLSCKMT